MKYREFVGLLNEYCDLWRDFFAISSIKSDSSCNSSSQIYPHFVETNAWGVFLVTTSTSEEFCVLCDVSRRKSRGLYFDRSVGCARSPAGRTTASHQHSGRSSGREQASKMNLNTLFL